MWYSGPPSDERWLGQQRRRSDLGMAEGVQALCDTDTVNLQMMQRAGLESGSSSSFQRDPGVMVAVVIHKPSEGYALGNLSVHMMIWPSVTITAGLPGPGSLYDQVPGFPVQSCQNHQS